MSTQCLPRASSHFFNTARCASVLPQGLPLDIFITNLFEAAYEHRWVDRFRLKWKAATVAIRPVQPLRNTKGYSSTYLAMGFANVRAGTWYKNILSRLSSRESHRSKKRKGARVRISLWDSLMFGRYQVPAPSISESHSEISTRVPFCIAAAHSDDERRETSRDETKRRRAEWRLSCKVRV